MRILYVANARIPTEKAHGVAILRACESFRAAGAEVTLVAAKRRNPITSDAEAYYGFPITTPVVRLGSLDLYGYLPDTLAFALQSLTFYRSLRRHLRTQPKDAVVYTRELRAVPIARRLGFRAVYECHHLSSDKRKFFARARQASRIVVISQALKNSFLDAGFKDVDILVAPSGVSLEVFGAEEPKDAARAALGLPAGFFAVYTGNFTTFGEDKGLADTLKALMRVPWAQVAAVGGSSADIARYQALAQELGVAARVRFVGQEPQTTLAHYQQAADALLMPFPDTPHYRNHMSPVKMFEYMAAHRPIIASDLPTIREVLTDMQAYIVAPGNSDALAAALARVREHPDEAAQKAAAARTAVEAYTWEVRALKVLDFIK